MEAKVCVSESSGDMKVGSRPKWEKSYDFLFAVVGCSIGLGNVWRFPYLCFKNGGGAFLLPYLLFAVALGIPVILLETSLGQYAQGGLIKSWSKVPVFKGIALANIVIILHMNTYYPILLVWALKYLVASFSASVPWSHCDNSWNTGDCISANGRRMNSSGTSNYSITSAEEFWRREVIGASDGIESIGALRTDLALYLVILWVGVYFCTFKGIKWTAKIVYVTATLPFILILIILVRGTTLDGAAEGIKYYLYPNITRLQDIEVWVSAGSQVFYSYGLGIGILLILGSYNKYHDNFYRNSIVIGASNSITSFSSGFAVFSTLGAMAKYKNTTVDQVASSGPGLAFIAYPEALSLLPLPQLWCALFFLTLMFLGFDSQFVYQECLVETLLENFPRIQRHRYSREIVQAIFAVAMCLAGFLMVTEGGIYVFELYNNHAVAGWCMFSVVFCELVAIGWLYGADRYWLTMENMIGTMRGRTWFALCWKYIGPTVCMLVTIYYLANTSSLRYEDYEYPTWAQVLAHLMSLGSFVLIPGYVIYFVAISLKNGKGLKEIVDKRCEKQDSKSEEMVTAGVPKLFSGRPQRQLSSVQCDPRSIYIFSRNFGLV